MLRLGNEVIGNVDGVRRFISQNGDFGRSCLSVDPYYSPYRPLSCSHEYVAWAGNNIDWFKRCLSRSWLIVTIGQQRDSLATTNRPDLVHAQHVAGRQNRRVWQATEVLLWWGGHNHGFSACFLSRDDVHDDRGRINRLTAGHVEPHTLNRLEHLCDRSARSQGCGVRGRLLIRMHGAHTVNGFLDCGSHVRIEFGCGLLELFGAHTHSFWAHTIKTLTKIEGCGRATIAY